MNQINEQKKADIINRYFCGVSVLELHRETGIGRTTIYRWLAEAKGKKDKLTPVGLREYGVMKRQCERQQKIIEILQNSSCLASSPLKDRLNEIEFLSGSYPVKFLCQAFKVPKGTYYNHTLRNKRDDSSYAQKRKELTPIIEKIYHEHQERFGPGKVTAILKDRGYKISERYVARIMHEHGWFSIRTNAKELYEISERRKNDFIKQKFKADAPNEIWVSDVSYFLLNGKKFYICVILDLFSRKAIACKISYKNSTQLVMATFNDAYQKRHVKAGLIFHTDNGCNYTSDAFMAHLRRLGVTQSFSRKHTPYDNAVCESFFSCIKMEQLYRLKYKSEREFKSSVFEYITYYNTARPHTFLRYLSPDKFEMKYAKVENMGSD